MPYLVAACVAAIAFSIRPVRSVISVLVIPPTRMIAAPPVNLARRCCRKSRSFGAREASICRLSVATRSRIRCGSPLPPMMMVRLFSTVTFLALPSISRVVCSSAVPSDALITGLPVMMAMSSRIDRVMKPSPGIFTAATCRPPRRWFTTSASSTALSRSSAKISSYALAVATASSNGSRASTSVIFFSWIRIWGA